MTQVLQRPVRPAKRTHAMTEFNTLTYIPERAQRGYTKAIRQHLPHLTEHQALIAARAVLGQLQERER